MLKTGFEPKFVPLKKIANMWEKATPKGKPVFYEGIVVKGGAVSRTGIFIDRNGLVRKGRDKFLPGTFLFRGEPVESFQGLVGGKPGASLALELCLTDLYSSRVSLLVYPRKGKSEPFYIGYNEILDPKSNPIFHAERPAEFDDELQGSMSFPLWMMPPALRSAWENCTKLAEKVRKDLIDHQGYPDINVRVGKGFELKDIIQPRYPQMVKDVRFAYGRRHNGEIVGQLTFFGEEMKF